MIFYPEACLRVQRALYNCGLCIFFGILLHIAVSSEIFQTKRLFVRTLKSTYCVFTLWDRSVVCILVQLAFQ